MNHSVASPQEAAVAVHELARRLYEPDRVAGEIPPGLELSLSSGYPGLALLFAELAHTEEEYREVAHAYLSAAARHASGGDQVGLHSGLPALAFATLSAVEALGEYAEVFGRLDPRIVGRAQDLVRAERDRLDEGVPGTCPDVYGVPTGLAGLGCYLLARGADHLSTLEDVLSCLVELTEPVQVDGRWVPGWYVQEESTGFLTGLGYGVCGPLALLALAWLSEVRVPYQDEAIERIAGWLLAWCQRDEAGPWWPAAVGLAEQLAGPGETSRPCLASWEFGTPGVARALQLAARALGEPDWELLAVEAARAVFTRPTNRWGAGDMWRTRAPGLRSGWAGLLQMTWRIARDSGDSELAERLPWLAGRLLEEYDADATFGFPQAGFLDGAAGVALALRTYATDTEPANGWDSALLLA
ncbi:hypothetical protein C3Y87_05160 [Carbonactinospora thermoautotrophica]|uniref:lanthionine synthetase C family protein n=1 Tax=Carbonactinospora thermoautotrophica TaxID=1469144 RepID=UPI002270685C|nr:lanthionine synthetase C family protein [Carbonactinospora thermoautotrophica]MCX9190810.1 hypothetical protein [Carbonactinospora thermoautotrophica]